MVFSVRSLSKNIISKRKSFSTMPKTAGIVIIGDEILKGQTQDTNSHYMCKTLRSIGVSVSQISVIGDDIELISSKVRKYSEKFDLVLTSGGIGPTHDDRTLEGVAKAFGENLHLDDTLYTLCKEYFGDKPLCSPEMKLAHIPESAQMRFGTENGKQMKFPLIFLKNVYIFPGIPVLLERQMNSMKDLFKTDDVFHTHTILVDAFETEIADVLSNCVEKYKAHQLSIGSYPDWLNNYYKVKLTVECTDDEIAKEAVDFLTTQLPEGSLLNDYKPALLGEGVLSLFEENRFANVSVSLCKNFKKSVEVIKEALTRYGSEEICIGFNGGKDCTALLFLYYAVLYERDSCRAENMLALFVKTSESFEEVERFMNETTKRYGLKTVNFEGKMKEELARLREERPEIKAVLMGTRATDPYSKNLQEFSPTDGDWPSFMRVNPILDWSYHDVWAFVRSVQIPYCVLYDRGYTSLGGKNKTERNEQLKFVDSEGFERYRPAYMLEKAENERHGRL